MIISSISVGGSELVSPGSKPLSLCEDQEPPQIEPLNWHMMGQTEDIFQTACEDCLKLMEGRSSGGTSQYAHARRRRHRLPGQLWTLGALVRRMRGRCRGCAGPASRRRKYQRRGVVCMCFFYSRIPSFYHSLTYCLRRSGPHRGRLSLTRISPDALRTPNGQNLTY